MNSISQQAPIRRAAKAALNVMIAVTIFSAFAVVFSGCESSGQNEASRIHGDAGVRIQSHDTLHLRPTR